MHKIGILHGREDTFPAALIDRINALAGGEFKAERARIDDVRMAAPCGYRLLVDRISQDVPFYRAYLKNAVLSGTTVINNPFWWSADDKFFNYALASKLGVAIPRTVLLPHKSHPPDISDLSLRNLAYPLNWQDIFEYIGFPAWLKPHSGGGWKNVFKVHTPAEFFAAYDTTGDLCMTLQQGIEFEDYYRCYVIGQEKVHLMPYDPRRPHAERYVKGGPPIPAPMRERLAHDCLTICRALGYDMNTVEFAVQRGVPYAIDFLNPAPDADVNSVGPENFEWMVNAMTELVLREARKPAAPPELRWANFLNPGATPAASPAPAKPKAKAKKAK